jgi:hypothetical protein
MSLGAFVRAGHFSGRLTWPFIMTSVPAAFFGGLMRVPVKVYAVLLSGSLTVAAIRLASDGHPAGTMPAGAPPLRVALPVGAGIGWLSGVVGVGGGIFLSPMLLLCRWADPKQTAASSACFILVNSVAGLSGRFAGGTMTYGTFWPFLASAFFGGLIGSQLGAHRFSGRTLRRVLSVVLIMASVKLLAVAGGLL